MEEFKNGFIDEPPADEDWELGASTSIQGSPLLPERNWIDYKQPLELQFNRYFDTYSCVSFAWIKSLILLAKVLYGEDWNKSERFISILSGTVPGKGNSLQKVNDTARKTGVVDQVEWPFTESMTSTEFFKVIPQNVKDLGLGWLKDYQLNWEWVDKNMYWQGKFNTESAWYALQYSPLHTAVDYSSPKKDGLIQNVRSGYNHSEVIVGGVYGKKWITLNSYADEVKEYAWDYNFYSPIRLSLTKLNQLTNDDMKMNLVRNSATGAIYLVDSDNVKHHIKDDKAFIAYLGNNAWISKDWVDAAPTETDPLINGVDIVIDNRLTLLINAIKTLLTSFGKALGIIK